MISNEMLGHIVRRLSDNGMTTSVEIIEEILFAYEEKSKSDKNKFEDIKVKFDCRELTEHMLKEIGRFKRYNQ